MYNMLRKFIPGAFRHKLITIIHRIKYKAIIGKGSYVSDTKMEYSCVVGDNSRITSSEIGMFTYITEGARISFAKIGRYCSIGPNIRIGNGSHPSKDFVSTSPLFYSKNNVFGTSFLCPTKYDEHTYTSEFNSYFVEIGHDVWFGANVVVLDGIIIGDGAIIGAGSIVTKDVKPFSVVAGIPAKELRMRFSDEEIEMLKKIRWWDKPLAWINENSKHFDNVRRLYSDSE